MKRVWDLLFITLALIAGVLWTLLGALLCLLGFSLREDWGHSCHRFWAKGVCALFGIRVQPPNGIPQLPSGGAILAPNHQSVFDMPILGTLPLDFKWVSKQEIGQLPFVGWAMRKMGCFFVSRNNAAQDRNVLHSVEIGIQEGKKVLIFPEGTRSTDGHMCPLKKGAFRVAINTGAPLYPIAIVGSFEIAAPRRLPEKRGHRVQIRIGSPLVRSPDETLEIFMERYRKEMVRLLDELKAT